MPNFHHFGKFPGPLRAHGCVLLTFLLADAASDPYLFALHLKYSTEPCNTDWMALKVSWCAQMRVSSGALQSRTTLRLVKVLQLARDKGYELNFIS